MIEEYDIAVPIRRKTVKTLEIKSLNHHPLLILIYQWFYPMVRCQKNIFQHA